MRKMLGCGGLGSYPTFFSTASMGEKRTLAPLMPMTAVLRGSSSISSRDLPAKDSRCSMERNAKRTARTRSIGEGYTEFVSTQTQLLYFQAGYTYSSALLEMARNTMAGLEFALTRLCNHVCDDLHSVRLGRLLVDKDDFARAVLALVFEENVAEMVNVVVEHLKVDAVFGCVHGESTDRKTGNGGDVARLSTLCLDDEYSPSRGGRRLATGVAVLD